MINSLWTTSRGLYTLLALLFIGIFISPITISDGLTDGVLIECIFALILITGVFTIPCSTTVRAFIMILAASAVIARIYDKFDHTNIASMVDNVLAAMTLVAFSVLIIKHFLLNKVTLIDRIVAAIAVYLIFGVLWARLYEVIYLFNPAAFTLNEKINPFSLTYFSFVTLLTIGYGDIVPISIAARSLAILEGVVGQLYLVILISSLVSEFSAIAVRSEKN